MNMEDVVNKFSDILIRIAFQHTKSLSDSEDIVQDVYMKLIKSSYEFEGEDHLKAWLIKVTYHRCKDFFKLSWYKRVVPIDDNMDFLAKEEQEIMEEIFQLKKEDRIIIYLYYYEGYSIKDIAQILEKKENTISSKLQRARKKLKVLIEEGENR